MGYSRIVWKDEDVAVAATVARIVGRTIRQLFDYWGRSTAPADATLTIADDPTAFLDVVIPEVVARNTQPLRNRDFVFCRTIDVASIRF